MYLGKIFMIATCSNYLISTNFMCILLHFTYFLTTEKVGLQKQRGLKQKLNLTTFKIL